MLMVMRLRSPKFFEVEAKPELLQSVKSVYPPRVTVRLELKVNVDGSVSDVKVLEGPEEFHQAAIDAISQYRFKPGTRNGKVVPVRMPQSIIFRLPKQQSTPPASGDADSSKVLEFYMVEVKPKVLHSVKLYLHPEEALRDSLEGKVFLKFRVNVDGSVSNVRVLRGLEVFHRAAIDAVSQFRFKPAEHNGKVVPVWMTQPINFQLPKQQSTPPASGDADSSKVLGFFMVEVKPKLMHAVKFVHPEKAIRDSLEGKVFLKFKVNVDGSVSDVRVLRGLGGVSSSGDRCDISVSLHTCRTQWQTRRRMDDSAGHVSIGIVGTSDVFTQIRRAVLLKVSYLIGL